MWAWISTNSLYLPRFAKLFFRTQRFRNKHHVDASVKSLYLNLNYYGSPTDDTISLYSSLPSNMLAFWFSSFLKLGTIFIPELPTFLSACIIDYLHKSVHNALHITLFGSKLIYLIFISKICSWRASSLHIEGENIYSRTVVIENVWFRIGSLNFI